MGFTDRLLPETVIMDSSLLDSSFLESGLTRAMTTNLSLLFMLHLNYGAVVSHKVRSRKLPFQIP